MSLVILMKKQRGGWEATASPGPDRAHAERLLAQFREHNPGYQFALVDQGNLNLEGNDEQDDAGRENAGRADAGEPPA